MKSPDPLEEQRRKELQQGHLGTGGVLGWEQLDLWSGRDLHTFVLYNTN